MNNKHLRPNQKIYIKQSVYHPTTLKVGCSIHPKRRVNIGFTTKYIYNHCGLFDSDQDIIDILVQQGFVEGGCELITGDLETCDMFMQSMGLLKIWSYVQ